MRNYLFVFIGGIAGGLLRVMATHAENPFTVGGMDLTIMLVNIAGAFLLGVFLSGVSRFKSVSPGMNLGVAVGFFGSFTTFSTLCMEAAGLLKAGSLEGFLLYVLVSCLAGLGAAELGFRIGDGRGIIRIGRRSPISLANRPIHNLVLEPIRDEEEDD